MEGLLALVCACVLAGAPPSDSALPALPDNPEQVVASNLAVQSALQEGRDQLLHGNYKQAVNALEAQLARINGNSTYLRTLQDAYRKYIRELRLSKQDEEANRYLHRLLILDRGAVLDATVAGLQGKASSSAGPIPGSSPKPTATVRLKSEDAPASEVLAKSGSDRQARALLARAEREFADHHYREARTLYEKASQADQSVTDQARERWAYSKLFFVADQVNHSETANASWSELEQEVKQALTLAPKLDTFGQTVLAAISKNRKNSSEPAGPQAVAVQHYARNAEGWLLAETESFRIYHNQPQELAQRVAEVAEHTRVDMQIKWFSGTNVWAPKCDVYLYADGRQYSQATGQYNSPGHSSVRIENARVIVRRIDLHCDDANMISAVLPHETTHVVLAGEFGGQFVPRWADEGMAVLTEPRQKVERHLENLKHCRQEGRLFHLQELVEMENYPDNPSFVGAFYAESVSLVDFLSSLRGPQEFTLFLREGLRYGYERSLQRHYDLQSFTELERRWEQHAFEAGKKIASSQ
jgi:tetratricopeptide (TPR) repeat protein